MKKSKKNYFAVAVGRKPGIYQSWSGEEGAQKQVIGHPGSVYQGFQTLDEAQTWLDNVAKGQVTSPPSEKETPKPLFSPSKEDDVSLSHIKKHARDKEPLPAVTHRNVDAPAELKNGKVILYTDGGCMNNPGPGGYGVVLLYADKRKELSGGFRLTTNNRMELTACIQGLLALKFPCPVIVFSDSQYLINGMTKGWALRWKKKGWMRTPDQMAENADLWAQLLELCSIHRVEFVWVKGHAGTPENERCDQLAKAAAMNKEIHQPDTPYEIAKSNQ